MQGKDHESASEVSDVLLFDTGTALAGELPSAAMAEKAGWIKVEEDAAPAQFKGDVVFLNGRIAVVLRKSAAGAEIYSNSTKGWQRRALLAPAKAETVVIHGPVETLFCTVRRTSPSVCRLTPPRSLTAPAASTPTELSDKNPLKRASGPPSHANAPGSLSQPGQWATE